MADSGNGIPSSSSGPPPGPPRRGRRPSGLDEKSRLERSRKSARECRARKKLRYQHLEELIEAKEQAVAMLYTELRQYEQFCAHIDQGGAPPMALLEKLNAKRGTLAVQRIEQHQAQQQQTALAQQQPPLAPLPHSSSGQSVSSNSSCAASGSGNGVIGVRNEALASSAYLTSYPATFTAIKPEPIATTHLLKVDSNSFNSLFPDSNRNGATDMLETSFDSTDCLNTLNDPVS